LKRGSKNRFLEQDKILKLKFSYSGMRFFNPITIGVAKTLLLKEAMLLFE